MGERRYGGFWRRLFAFLVDGIILYFLSLILFLAGLPGLGLKKSSIEQALASQAGIPHLLGAFMLLYVAAALLAGMAYFTWFHGMGGRTPGKMLLGLQVIQASGEPMTPGVAFLRWVGYLISAPLFCLGFLWIALDARKQGWHDKIAATLVIRKNGEPDRICNPLPKNGAGATALPAPVSPGRSPIAGETENAVAAPPKEDQGAQEKGPADEGPPQS